MTSPSGGAGTPGSVARPTRLLPSLIDPAALLEALDGVCYLTAPDGTILHLGRAGWSAFAVENGAPQLTIEQMLGTSLFDIIRGTEVRLAYRELHQAVVEGQRPRITFEYRCDSPLAERHMRMAISAVVENGRTIAVLYQSQIVRTLARPPVPLFDRSQAVPPGAPTVLLCSFCQRVLGRAGQASARPRWMTAVEYYQAGGPAVPVIEDVICPACEQRVVAGQP